jgi:hypothetical protein
LCLRLNGSSCLRLRLRSSLIGLTEWKLWLLAWLSEGRLLLSLSWLLLSLGRLRSGPLGRLWPWSLGRLRSWPLCRLWPWSLSRLWPWSLGRLRSWPLCRLWPWSLSRLWPWSLGRLWPGPLGWLLSKCLLLCEGWLSLLNFAIRSQDEVVNS